LFIIIITLSSTSTLFPYTTLFRSDFDGMLDSTRTGIIYLSETISEIAYQKPDKFTEKIIASKVSGNDNGFSFNSAQSANISFYEDRKSTRLNSSHVKISYAVFCLK